MWKRLENGALTELNSLILFSRLVALVQVDTDRTVSHTESRSPVAVRTTGQQGRMAFSRGP